MNEKVNWLNVYKKRWATCFISLSVFSDILFFHLTSLLFSLGEIKSLFWPMKTSPPINLNTKQTSKHAAEECSRCFLKKKKKRTKYQSSCSTQCCFVFTCLFLWCEPQLFSQLLKWIPENSLSRLPSCDAVFFHVPSVCSDFTYLFWPLNKQ